MIINKLILFTTQIEAQKNFYSDILKFPKLAQKKDEISFQIGQSILKFQYCKDAKPYHFAFNISSNKAQEAFSWLQKKVEILDYQGEKIVDFRSWDAEAIYFYDADNNIVEFIARHGLNQNSFSVGFGLKNVLGISEIGLPTDSIPEIYNTLNTNYNQPIYDGNLETFSAIGDQNGLFITVPIHKKWMPTDTLAVPADFEIVLTFDEKPVQLNAKSGKLYLSDN